MKKRVLALLLGMAMICRLFTGCGGNTEEKDTPEKSAQRPLHGQVTDIHGSVLTLSLGSENTAFSPGDGTDGPPPMSDNESEKPPQTASENGTDGPPSMPDNPAGGPPDGDGHGPQTAGEEREITVTEDTTFTVQDGPDSEKGNLEDLFVNAMIQVTLKDDGVTAASIVIQKIGPGQEV